MINTQPAGLFLNVTESIFYPLGVQRQDGQDWDGIISFLIYREPYALLQMLCAGWHFDLGFLGGLDGPRDKGNTDFSRIYGNGL